MTNPLERVRGLLTANINELLDRAENPLVMLNQLVRDLHEQRGQLRTMLINTMANERLLEQRISEHMSEAGKWQHKAVFSVGQQRDDLARRALANRLREEEAIRNLRSQQAVQQTEVARIEELAERLEARIRELEQRRDMLVARHGERRTPQSSQTLDVATRIANNLEGAEHYLNRLSDQADRDAHTVDIHMEQTQHPASVDADDELETLLEGSRIEQELQALKTRVQNQLNEG